MQLKKHDPSLKIAVLFPKYGREEYTTKSKKALYQGGYQVFEHQGKEGLRNAIIDFFEQVRGKYDIIAKIDNDCVVPQGWMDEMVRIFRTTDVDILSPNVVPSNAAIKYGEDTEDDIGYRRGKIVGGLWCMKVKMLEDIVFDRYPVDGIKGAFNILKQIVLDKNPKIGWTTKVTVQDVGHWSGAHQDHIKSREHEEYSKEIGRQVSWEAEG